MEENTFLYGGGFFFAALEVVWVVFFYKIVKNLTKSKNFTRFSLYCLGKFVIMIKVVLYLVWLLCPKTLKRKFYGIGTYASDRV